MFEFVGTLILILLGDGVVACTTLARSKGNGGGWTVITMGWGFAVMCGVFIAGPISGAHLNPAITIGLACAGKFAWSNVAAFSIAQIAGGMSGAALVYAFYKDHFDATEDEATKLGCFATMPAIAHAWRNLFCEIVGTWLLVLVILAFSTSGETPEVGMGSLGALPVTMLIMSIGMSLGGATGYAINPARDLGPRIVHSLLLRPKSGSGWSYGWIPVIGPVIGAVLAALTFIAMY